MPLTLEVATRKLHLLLETHDPETFSSSWIFSQSQPLYNYFRKEFRTENGDIDWDSITPYLERRYQKRWMRYKRKSIKFYEKQEEVDRVIMRYKEKLYLFVVHPSKKDREVCNRMVTALVRLAQKGNTCAIEELTKWVTYVVDEWIDRYPQINKWKGYADEVKDKITGCALRFRYTGSFLGYLFKTLEYSARGKPLSYSLGDKMGDTDKTRVDYIIEENETYL